MRLPKISYKLAWLNDRRLLYLFAVFSTAFGFWFIFNMNVYLPWQIRLWNGVKLTLIGHLGIWLATLNVRGKPRFAIAGLLLFSIIPIFFLWWNLHLLAAIGATGYMGWVVLQTLKEKHFGY